MIILLLLKKNIGKDFKNKTKMIIKCMFINTLIIISNDIHKYLTYRILDTNYVKILDVYS